MHWVGRLSRSRGCGMVMFRKTGSDEDLIAAMNGAAEGALPIKEEILALVEWLVDFKGLSESSEWRNRHRVCG